VLSYLADTNNNINMRLNDRRFDGGSRYFRSNKALQPVAGSQSWFAVFQPVNNRGLQFIAALLKLFFELRICCHCNVELPTFIAGFLKFCNSASILFALKDHPVLKLIFQIEDNTQPYFISARFVSHSCVMCMTQMSVSTTSAVRTKQ
jgi:hypothetical protein